MCLADSAHGLVPNHAIFRGPRPIELEWVEFPTPGSYARYSDGAALGATMRGVRFQTSDYRTNEAIQPGVVSTPFGFDDSPDAEVIAAGINTKGPRSVALGRHGNFFHWGFSARPELMTTTGQKAFVNAIAYIHGFDGAAPLVRQVSRSREWALEYGYWAEHMADDYARTAADYAERAAQKRELQEAAKSRELTARELRIANGPDWTLPAEAQYISERLGRSHPEELVLQFGTDGSRYAAHYRTNLEYLRYDAASRFFVVDEDCRALQVSNRALATLDRCVALLDTDSTATVREREHARAILSRYTDQTGDWGEWLSENRNRLFFSDVGGYRWFVEPASADPETPAGAPAEAAGKGPAEGASQSARAAVGQRQLRPTHDAPVAFAAAASREADGSGSLVVRVAIKPGWHVYAEVPDRAPYPVTTLTANLPDGARLSGDWVLPPTRPSLDDPEILVWEGDLVFEHQLLDLPAGGPLSVDVHYQACDAGSCLAPATVRVPVQFR